LVVVALKPIKNSIYLKKIIFREFDI